MGSAMHSDIRHLVREIISEELKALNGAGGAHADTTPKPQVREESVDIASSSDLQAFALRILDLAKDGQTVAEIRSGRWRFRLAASGTSRKERTGVSEGPASSEPGKTVEFQKGLVTERQVAALPDGAHLSAGPMVRFTPLALDEVRRRGIRLNRRKT
jgi:hypothetical protein